MTLLICLSTCLTISLVLKILNRFQAEKLIYFIIMVNRSMSLGNLRMGIFLIIFEKLQYFTAHIFCNTFVRFR